MAKAALAIGGKTLHSVLKIPIAGVICGMLEESQLDGVTILIIDKVTLLDMYLINQVDQIVKKVKKTGQPFGGLITILFGDFLQLPPINTSADQKEEVKYIFDSHIWKNIVTFHLTKRAVLLRWREGKMIGEDQSFLKERSISSRLNTDKDYEFVAKKINEIIGVFDAFDVMFVTRLNFVVDWMNYFRFTQGANQQELRQLSNAWAPPQAVVPAKILMAPSLVCINMRILITESQIGDNDDKPRMLNGMMRSVLQLRPAYGIVDRVLVILENGIKHRTRQIPRSLTGDLYWPFRPCYATTFHKVQGLTLRHVAVDTHHNLKDGMFYVGCSRVRSRHGSNIVGPIPKYIKFNREVLGKQREIEASNIIPSD
ncbi:hypothetical protein CRE_09853 [Caenorhabditis remanei]|uniref:ATP-dependent DNA helicase n=1 Tax=Caenorhabditis remanei TaxID=31234 RepID=E3NJY3_CAERE|nr:hypothetical protein CRE_09853 [Caenorhabditis remanei]